MRGAAAATGLDGRSGRRVKRSERQPQRQDAATGHDARNLKTAWMAAAEGTMPEPRKNAAQPPADDVPREGPPRGPAGRRWRVATERSEATRPPRGEADLQLSPGRFAGASAVRSRSVASSVSCHRWHSHGQRSTPAAQCPPGRNAADWIFAAMPT